MIAVLDIYIKLNVAGPENVGVNSAGLEGALQKLSA